LAADGQAVLVTDAVEGRLYVRDLAGAAVGEVGVGRQPVDVVAATDRVYVVHHAADLDPATSDGVAVVDATALDLLVSVSLGSGHGERLSWIVRPAGTAEAHLDSTTALDVAVTGTRAGPALIRAVYACPDHTPPYTFQVRFNLALEAAERGGTTIVIRKDQYDLIMNVLNALHPIGVEVDTRVIREHVAELGGSLLDVFPPYTYPEFRVHGPRPAVNVIEEEKEEQA
jgi:hypothetical protein